MWVAFNRMLETIQWRMDRCMENGDLSQTVVGRIERMVGEAKTLVQDDNYRDAITKLTNTAIYLGRYMYVS
jgi:hypothetical protein